MRSIQAIPVVLTLLALGAEGCGAAGHGTDGHAAPPAARPAPFAWIAGGPAPVGWPRAAPAGGGALARPPGWARVAADPGSVSFARRAPGGAITAYLNATPATRAETLSGWARFRLAHNAHEGDRDVQLVATARDVRADAARASCVMDDYATVRRRYREIACLVVSPRSAAVVVGAATPRAWTRRRPDLQRAIAGFAAS